jgi:hypothetical protein
MQSYLKHGLWVWSIAIVSLCLGEVSLFANATPPPPKPKSTPAEQSASSEGLSDGLPIESTHPEQSSDASGTDQPPAPIISDGSEITVDGKGISMTPPVGWTVRRDLPRTTLFLGGPKANEKDYPRNISVMRFPGEQVIHEETAEKFSKFLVSSFPQSSPEIAGYDLRNHQLIQMNDGREGLLFYTDFNVRGVAMMQAHILISSQTAHYLMTYTDVATHFEDPQLSSQFLGEAWSSMVSVKLDSPSPKPEENAKRMMIAGGVLLLIAAVTAGVRRRMASREYDKFSDSNEDASGESSDAENISHLSSQHSLAETSSPEEAIDTKHGGKLLGFKNKGQTKGQSDEMDATDDNFGDADNTIHDDFKDDVGKAS